jgi:hypothetical protein
VTAAATPRTRRTTKSRTRTRLVASLPCVLCLARLQAAGGWWLVISGMGWMVVREGLAGWLGGSRAVVRRGGAGRGGRRTGK